MTAKKIVNKTAEKIVKEAKTLCSMLFKEKLQDVYLYGSYARGDFNKYSDVDILVTVDMDDEQLIKYRKFIMKIDHELTWKYDIIVSIITVPTGRFSRFVDILPFYRNVKAEGINYGN